MKVAYLCSEYPAISHTFVLREVEALRRLGASIATFSIRRTPSERLLSRADREADESTIAILPPRWGRLLAAHARLLSRAPLAYLSALRFALGLAGPGLRGRIWQVFYFAEAVFLWNECRVREIEHVHAHLANAAADVAMVAARIGSAAEPGRAWSWSFTMHGPTELFDLRHYRLAEKTRSARFVVCISDFARSQLMAISEPETWERLHVVHMGIPVDDFSSRAPALPTGPPRLLYIGRLVPEKGQAVLLEAIALLTERGYPVEATLVGEGPMRPALERLSMQLGIASQVDFPGAVGQDDLRELYEGATVFCLPSFAEGVPVVLMEAMSMEVPAISTRIAGIPELIEDAHSGFLVAPGRPEELADRIAILLDDPHLRRKLGANGREKVLREFNAEKSAAQLYELFAKELDGSPSTAGPAVLKIGA